MTMLTILARALIWLAPAVAAIAAALGFYPWLLGIPGDAEAGYAEGWWLGLLALAGYISAYFVFIILRLLARLAQAPKLAAVAHGFIWVALALFAGIQYVAWSKILAA